MPVYGSILVTLIIFYLKNNAGPGFNLKAQLIIVKTSVSIAFIKSTSSLHTGSGKYSLQSDMAITLAAQKKS